jgi:phenylacetate-CoA ligase
MNWNTVMKVACRASGHSRYGFDQQLQANERISAEAIKRMQWEKLKALIEHAYGTVPYYRELFDQEKITPRDVTNLREYAALPVLTKNMLRTRGVEAFRSTRFPGARLRESTTSGSTGEPLRLLREHVYEEWRMTGSWRAWRWGGWTPGDKIMWIWREWWPKDPITRLEKRLNWWITRRMLCDVSEMSDATMQRWVKQLEEYQPNFIHGFPSAIERFARYIDDKRIKVAPIRTVFTNGEMLQTEQREIIQGVFQTRVHNVYGSNEVHPIAAECRLGALHLSTDLIVPELIESPEGGGLKRVILTPLHAYGMPLLRYEVGDLASSSSEICSCGLPFPVLEGLVGRAADLFPLPNGRVVHGQILIAYLSGLSGVERFQFRQRQKDLLNLYIVKAAGFSPQAIDAMQKKIEQDLNVRVEVDYVSDIPRTSHGKFRYTVCEVNS